jgi:pimeloyl-ACP methyl ester carboxylesterase
MRRLFLASLIAGFAGLGFFAFFALRRSDISYAVLDCKYADPRSRFLKGPGDTSIHYRDEGRVDRPTLMLVHGYFSSLHTWEPWVERLRRHYRIISIDLPGHGLTRTPVGFRIAKDSFFAVIDAVAAHLNLQKFVLVGSSMGGAAAWDYASARPEKIEALVLVSAAGWTPAPNQGMMNSELQNLLRSSIGTMLCDLDNSAFLRTGLRASFWNAALANDAMIERHVELARAPMNRDVLMQIALNNDALEANNLVLARIQAPTLVLHGRSDRVVPVQDGRRFASAIHNARLIIYDEVGHLLHEENAVESAKDVHGFIQQALRPKRQSQPRQLLAA